MSPVLPYEIAEEEEGTDNYNAVKEDPPGSKEIGKEEIPQRLVDEIRQNRSDDAREDPAAIMEEISQQKTEDDSGKEVEEE